MRDLTALALRTADDNGGPFGNCLLLSLLGATHMGQPMARPDGPFWPTTTAPCLASARTGSAALRHAEPAPIPARGQESAPDRGIIGPSEVSV